MEGRTIQNRLKRAKQRPPEDIDRVFAKLMLQAKVNAAMRFLSEENDKGGILPLSSEIIQGLTEKHPKQGFIHPETLLEGPLPNISLSYFDSIDEDMIKRAAMQTKGAAGPSQLDATQCRNILVGNLLKKEGKALREQLATSAKHIATKITDPTSLASFVACRLIPLDKCPGIWPIGVEEVIRRIVGKAISWVLKPDIQKAAGPLQVCTGLKGGAEAAIHSMKDLFSMEENDAVILVDATNAFNTLNRIIALHNIQFICLSFAKILINTYRAPARLFISGGAELQSEEGTTHGDNLAMVFYALGTNLLLTTFKEKEPFVKQVWYADDATGCGKHKHLLN